MGPAWILACACAQLAVARRERSLTALAEGTQAACGQGAGLVATETDEAQLGRQTAASGHPEPRDAASNADAEPRCRHLPTPSRGRGSPKEREQR